MREPRRKGRDDHRWKVVVLSVEGFDPGRLVLLFAMMSVVSGRVW